MSRAADSLWDLTTSAPRIDAASLARAVEEAAADADDYRTRLLIRDSVRAIETHWGTARTNAWLSNSSLGGQIRAICENAAEQAENDEHGFPSIKRRIVDATKPETILQFLRDLSRTVTKPTRLVIGGSIALIVTGYLQRKTEDIDIVDEVPQDIRAQHQMLAELEERYGLQLTHFQSRYLPAGWATRVHSIGTFGLLQAFAVDPYDMFLSKLFSSRSKDRDDLRALLPHLNRSVLESRLRETTGSFRAEPTLGDAAKGNWYVLFGEDLPK